MLAFVVTEGMQGKEGKKHWRCGNSRGVIICLVCANEAYFSLAACMNSSLYAELHAYTKPRNMQKHTQTKINRTDKILHNLHRLHYTEHTNHMHTDANSTYTWLTHTTVAAARKTDRAICSAQSFPELSKPEPALNSQS